MSSANGISYNETELQESSFTRISQETYSDRTVVKYLLNLEAGLTSAAEERCLEQTAQKVKKIYSR